MKLLCSEANPDHAHYVYPYVVWGFLEPGETPADAFDAGFLPSSPNLDRFYLARQLRVPLAQWQATSENRRILRKTSSWRLEVIPRAHFNYSPACRRGWLDFAEARFGVGVMPEDRLDRMMSHPVVSHILQVTDAVTGEALGNVLMYLQPNRVAFYYFAFYSLAPELKFAGMGLMTRAVEHFAQAGWPALHLGTCYSEAALYKTQFEPVEFFNGFRWSRNLEELKHLVRRAAGSKHRLETAEFLAFQPTLLAELAAQSRFRTEPQVGE